MAEQDSFDLSITLSEPFSLNTLDPSDRSNRDSFTPEEEADLLENEPYDVFSRRIKSRKAQKDLYLKDLALKTKKKSRYLNLFIKSRVEIRRIKSARSVQKIKQFHDNAVLKDEKKRDTWIKANLIRRVLFGPKYNLRFLTAASRIEQRYPWLSLEQSQSIVETFKLYRRKVYWIFVDRGMMPEDSLDETYPSISPGPSMNEAFIADYEESDGSENENESENGNENENEAFEMNNVLEALPSPDQGFDESVSHFPNIDLEILPKYVSFIDDPMDMENQDYMKALNMTNEDRLLSLEYMLDEIEQTFYPDPPDITFDNSDVFDEFDSSFSSSCLDYSDKD